MAIINDIATIRKYLSVNVSSSNTSITPYVVQAQSKYLRKYLSKQLTSELDQWISNNKMPFSAEFEKLLFYVEAPLSHFAYYMAAPDFDIKTGDAGFTVVSTEGLVPASSDRVNRFQDNRLALAYSGIEDMLEFLEENEDDYPQWRDSEATKYRRGLFINSAREFNDYYNIHESRVTFIDMRPKMENIENLYLVPSISVALAARIKQEIKDKSLTSAVEAILPNIKRSLANLSAGEFFDDAKAKAVGENYLQQVKITLELAPGNYPEWASSSAFEGPRGDRQIFPNSSDNSIFVFGAQ